MLTGQNQEPISSVHDRLFIREGLLSEIKKRKRKNYYIYMFNDMLLKTKTIKGGDKLPYHQLPRRNAVRGNDV